MWIYRDTLRTRAIRVKRGADYGQIAQVGMRWVATRYAEGDPGSSFLDALFNVVGSWQSQSSFVVDQQGSAVGWVADDGSPMVLDNGATKPVRLARVPAHNVHPVASVGSCCEDPEVDETAAAQSGCERYRRHLTLQGGQLPRVRGSHSDS